MAQGDDPNLTTRCSSQPTWQGGYKVDPVYQQAPAAREPVRALNGQVAVEPFAPIEKRIETKGGVTQLNMKVMLYPSRVVFGGDKFRSGDIVYVKADTAKVATTSFTAEGQTFVLIPEGAVVLVHEQSPR